MMTKNEVEKGSKFSMLTLIPLAVMLFFGVALLNGQDVNTDPEVFTVIVDAGHGGKDPGALSKDKISEKDISLAIAKMLEERASSNPKINVILTREKDEFLELHKRIVSDADLLLSIHTNSTNTADVSGIECFVAKDSEYKDKSEIVGKSIIAELSRLSGIKTNPSPKEANFFVLRESRCPALLINIGYISNPNDLSYITNQSNQALICDKILHAIDMINR